MRVIKNVYCSREGVAGVRALRTTYGGSRLRASLAYPEGLNLGYFVEAKPFLGVRNAMLYEVKQKRFLT
jgi:hypothetical protein